MRSTETSIDPFAAKRIQVISVRIARQPGFANRDANEIAQELWLHYWRALPQFDRARGNSQAFATIVIRCAVRTYLRRNRAAKRDVRRLRTLGSEGLDVGRIRPSQLLGVSLASCDDADGLHCARSEQRMTVAHVKRQLAQEDRALCDLLSAGNISAAARALGQPRSTICDRIRQLRMVFESAGLRPYFSKKFR